MDETPNRKNVSQIKKYGKPSNKQMVKYKRKFQEKVKVRGMKFIKK